MSPGPIPWVAINEYAKRHNVVRPDEFQTLKLIIWKVDKAFLDWQEENRKKS